MPSAMPSRTEFVALMAMLMATIAFSIDAMLPALPEIAADLGGGSIVGAQLVVGAFVLGMGFGTFFTGALSDAFGRRAVMLSGAAIYAAAAFAATRVESLEALLVARAIQGLGAAGPRVVALAVMRDLYAGRGMARILSFVMTVFALVPAVAPAVGAVLIALGGWPAVFWAFVGFAALSAAWLFLRLPETLPRDRRRPFRAGALRAALVEVTGLTLVRRAIVVQGLCLGMLFAMISSVQPIYEQVYDRVASFPAWFGAIAVVAASSGLLNAALVVRLGMRRLVASMVLVQSAVAAVVLGLAQAGLTGDAAFAVFVLWQVVVFFQAGMTIGNLNALALEPLGHIAGMAASIVSALSTVLAVLLALPPVLAFDGTIVPLAVTLLVYGLAARAITRAIARLPEPVPAASPGE